MKPNFIKKHLTLLLLLTFLIPPNFLLAQNLSVPELTDNHLSLLPIEANLDTSTTAPFFDDSLPAEPASEPSADPADTNDPTDPAADPSADSDEPTDTPTDESTKPTDELSAETTEPENPLPRPQDAPNDPWLNIAGLQELFSSDLFTGEARLNIPFSAPAGRNGLTPELSLNYSSFKNDLLSPYGYAFDFSNSSIFRTARHGVDQIYNRSDFAVKLGGKYNELVLVDAGLGLYQGKLGNDVNKYFLEGTGSNAKWRVLDSTGVQYYFGGVDSSKQKDPNNPEHIFQWMLNKTVDQYGNKIAYTYFSDHNQIYPDAIQYVFNSETESLYRVKFDYSQKSTSASSYQTQFEIETYYLLSSIKIQQNLNSNWQTQKEYALTYDYLDQAISRLISITPKAGTLTLPSLNFAYYAGGAAINLLQTINNNKGGVIDLEYLPSTQYVDPETGNRSQLPFIIDTLHQVKRTDQTTGLSAIQTFNYFGGHYYVDYADIFAHEYVGFHKVFSTDSLGQITKTYFHQSEFSADNSESVLKGEYDDHISKKGKIYRQEIYDSNSRLFQSTVAKWDKRALPGENRWLVWPAKTVNLIWDGDATHKDKAETSQYDDFGNVTEQTEFGEVVADANTGAFTDLLTDKRTTKFAYALNESANIVSLPSSQIIFDYQGVKIQEQKYYYDNQPLGQTTKGSLTLKEQWLNTNSSFIKTNYEYNQYGLLTKQIDPLNNSTAFQYDSFNLYPVAQINALDQQTQYSYDYALGLLKRTTDPNNIVQENVYDGFGRLVKVLISDQNQSVNLIVKQEIVYNDFVQPILILQKDYLSSEANPKETYQYFDGFGRIIQTKTSADQANQFNTASLIYDELGRVKKEYLSIESSSFAYQTPTQIDSQAKIYSYDANNRPTKIQTAVGSEIYNYLDWQTQIIDSNNHQTDRLTDAFGRLIKVKEHNGQNVYSTEYQYDSRNNLIKIIDAEQNEREFVYDSLNRQIKNELLHQAGIIASTYLYQYDQNSNKIQETDPDGDIVNYSYDQLNRVLTKDDPKTANIETKYVYDQAQFGIGQLAKIQTAEYNLEYQYNGQGKIKQENRAITKPLPRDQILTGWAWSDQIGWISFNCQNREKDTGKTCLNQTDPNFNPNQNLVDYSVKIDGETGIIAGYGWSEHLGWISFNRSDTGAPPTSPYDDFQTSFIAKAELDPAKPTVDLTGWGRALVFGNASIPSANSPDFDGWIKLAGTATNGSIYGLKINKQIQELEGWAYGGAGIGWISFNCLNANACGASDYQVKSKIAEPQEPNPSPEFQTYITKYTFDNYGSLQNINYPDNSIAEYDYNQIGKIAKTKRNGQTLVSQIKYGPTEAIKSIAYANNTESIYAYDPNELYRLKNKKTTVGSTVLQNISYAYDPVGNITRIQDIGTQTPKDGNYVYDDLNRLTQAQITAGTTITENFTYSGIGNILSKTGIGSYQYNDSRHPTAATSAGGETFAYDASGNLITAGGDGGGQYDYDFLNRLTNITSPIGTSRYIYADGYERIQKQLPDGKFTNYVGEIAEINELGEFTDYVFADPPVGRAGKIRVATVDKTGLYYHTNDHLSSANLITDANGAVVQKLDYLPFGSERLNEKTANFETRFTFTDQERDDESGLLYYGARYYDPVIGRFTQADMVVVELTLNLLSNPQTLNAYSYALNNPLRIIDPTGKYNIETGQIEKNDNPEIIVNTINEAFKINTNWETVRDVSFYNDRFGNKSLGEIVGKSLLIGTNITAEITEHLNELNQSRSSIANLLGKNSLALFASHFPWDIKHSSDPILGGGKDNREYWSYIYNGEFIRFDAPGNINYGYVAKSLGLSNLAIQAGALVEQIGDNLLNGINGKGFSFSDNKGDSKYVQKGINSYTPNKSWWQKLFNW